jgi:hypothetical protein
LRTSILELFLEGASQSIIRQTLAVLHPFPHHIAWQLVRYGVNVALANPIQVGSDTIADFFSDIYFSHKYLAS